MYRGEERRKYKRVEKRFIVSFQVKEHAPGRKPTGGWDMIAVLNLGAGGMLFYYNKKLDVGSLLDLKINYSASEEPITCEGEIIRVEEVANVNMFLTALVFSSMDEKKRSKLNAVIEELHAAKAEKPELRDARS